ncbi:MAG: radical SAM protein [Candidatus Eremiobacteraeota bacterium]|nr:radical SAM protein [Candidatus Eremiobacteraeota bacterium]
MEVLKEKTRALCSECYEEVDGRIIEEGGEAVIEKFCPTHGTTRGVIEKDASFMKKILSAPRRDDPNPFPYRCLMINATHACNLKCHLCYLPERDTALDLSLEEIKESIDAYPGYSIAFSGGEPTLYPHLPELIRYTFEKKKIPAVITNGVKLADYRYVKELREAGLTLLNFSFNGLKEEAYLGIEGTKLLDIKLRALENVRKVGGIYTQVSFTMARGVNDDQFGEVIKYALKNNDFIYQIRARVAAGIGRRLGEKDIYLSDFLKLLAEETAIPCELFVDHWVSQDWFPNPFMCSIEYFEFLRSPAVAKALGFDGNAEHLEAYLSKFVGEENAVRVLRHKPEDYRPPVTRPTFLFVLFSWPDKHILDYEEIKGLNLDILTRDKKVVNYWDGLIRNEKLNFL